MTCEGAGVVLFVLLHRASGATKLIQPIVHRMSEGEFLVFFTNAANCLDGIYYYIIVRRQSRRRCNLIGRKVVI